MLSTHLLAFTLAMASSVHAGIFPPDSQVKMLTSKGFKKAMEANVTSMVAFVAPWCGHCQKMAPEYAKAALGVYPLLPFYAVDCDNAKNKRLCAEQGVKGFPTIKLFPRGKSMKSIEFDMPQRTSSSFFYFSTRRVPNPSKKFYYHEEIDPWMKEHIDETRILLLSKDKHAPPLLWKVLANKYDGQLSLAVHRDRKGRTSVKMGMEAGGVKEPKVLIYPAGSMTPIRYQGIAKLDSLTKFFDSILDGTADLQVINEEAAKEEFVLSEEEQEIERQQEAQRIALAHGGFTDLIDFEKAIKDGAGKDFHDSHGYGGMMGVPDKYKKEKPAAVTTEGGHGATVPPTPAPTAAPEKEETKEEVAVEEAVEEAADVADEEDIIAGEEQVVFEVPREAADRPKDEL
ncbi:hypothetical protein BDQ17DRAFT_1329070 [Cyathus striatus]|nr:hypothetical protein BDQ17DRAFT_1329070 [Cyathus striatus]